MDNAQLEAFEKALVTACDKHVADGGKLIQGQFFIDDKNVCPLRATTGAFDSKEYAGYATKLSQVLGFAITDQDIKSFYFAYDETNYFQSDNVDKKVWELGLKMREKYKPIPAEKPT